MRAIRFNNSGVSLEAWLFGEDGQQNDDATQRPPPAPAPPSASTAAASSSSVRVLPPPSVTVSRSNSLPVNSVLPASANAAARAKKKTSLTVSTAAASSAAASALSRMGRDRGKKGSTSSPPSKQTQGVAAAASASPQVELFPVSAKLRKFFRPNRIHWNKMRLSSALTAEEKQRQLLGLSTASFQRLQGHVPFTLKEIVKDPKKLPYLLRWLSTDNEEAQLLASNREDASYDETGLSASRSNYHQVLLFLLEIEQLHLVTEEKRKDQALKIWNKYIDHGSEFEISSTLELTTELEALVRESIDCSDKVLDSFFPIQKLAYMRLTREEMPRFLKSPEYLQMLIDTENDTQAVPMERILMEPRAAHYFLLFLMQSRQHFELYFWLHVEYVLKPLMDDEKKDLFWKLARVLVKKAQNDSQAITLTTKSDLERALDAKRLVDDKSVPQPGAKALFAKAQQEIFVMLRSSWYQRFMKSNLYQIAMQDAQVHLDRDDSKEDSPPKLLARTFSSLEYAAQRLNSQRGSTTSETSEHLGQRGPGIDSSSDTNASSEDALPPGDGGKPSTDLEASEEGSASSGDESSQEDHDFANVVLNLESIIRLTKLPDGLQVHYRPHSEAPGSSLGDAASPELNRALDRIFTFATFVEKHGDVDTKATLMLMPIANPAQTRSAHGESIEDITRRIKAFLVPDGRILLHRRTPQDSDADKLSVLQPPEDIIFHFQQSGRDGFLSGCVYLTYEPLRFGTDRKELYVARGVCLLSRFPLVRALRRTMERHVRAHGDTFDPDRLAALLAEDVSVQSIDYVSRIPLERLQRRPSQTESAMTASTAAQLLSRSSPRAGSLESCVDISVQPLFRHFGSAIALQILACALLECSIVFVSSSYSLLTTCAEAVRSLLRPFSWCHVYAPVLPKSLLSYLQCPTPILVGLHSSYADREDLPPTGFYAVADMDRMVLEFVGAESIGWRRVGLRESRAVNGSCIMLPTAFEVAKHKLDAIWSPDTALLDRAQPPPSTPNSTASDVSSVEENVRVICLDLFTSLLDGYAEACLVVGDTKESVVIFDETQFLSMRPNEEATFYQALFRTQCFSEIVSAQRIDLQQEEACESVATPKEAQEPILECQEGVV
ncbi:hypothetical protein PINS_up002049 [Pythium insidiosum]|nr:hypothetical protein PINS_up002049 [Pythium insidiosum]